MESLFLQIADTGEKVVEFSWLPLAIWTFLSGLTWIFFRSVQNIHPQYQYHTRLALLIALPAGFVTIAIIQLVESVFLSSPSDSLTFISVVAPFEMSVTPGNSSIFTTASILYSGIVLLLAVGLIFFASRNIAQWVQLNRLKSKCAFWPVKALKSVDITNLQIIAQTDKDIRIAFLDKEIIPVTFGIRNPIILLPESIKEDQEKLNMVLRHELTHISQNDFLSNVIITFTQTLFWFHPFVHFLKKELIDYREIRCDSFVLSNNSVSRKKYASLLLELLPMPNINKELSVNMAQESSNLKKRIQMITQQQTNRPIPKWSSIAIFACIILSTAVAMSCTDMQTQNVFDEEELNLMTDVDQTGERGYHQIIIFMSDEEQSEKHQSKLEKLNQLSPEHIHSIDVLKGEVAIEKFGDRGSEGVILINTKLNPTSYNTVLQTLGMEKQDISTPPPPATHPDHSAEDFFVVVEEMPELIGGLAQLQQKIRYPQEARSAGIEGRVYVQFIVNEQGNVEKPRVIRGIGGGADEEALRVIREAKFEPGLQRGKPVRVQYSIPFFFRLEGSENSSNDTSPVPPTNGENETTIIGYQQSEPVIEEPDVNYNTMDIDLERSGDQIQGVVTNAESGEPLVGANIIVQGTNTGTVSDESGQFRISGAEENVSQIMVSYIGYRSVHLNL